MVVDPNYVREFQKFLLDWYKKNKRDFPRRKTNDPYAIWISELMLQQTQTQRVVPKYTVFLETFPTIHSLAQASKTTLLRIWSGLGYNKRALYAQKTAMILIEKYQAKFPNTVNELQKLPGIGPYTAAAICVFAYNQNIPVIDINIKRVLLTVFDLPKNYSRKELMHLAHICIPIGESRDRHNALMDYGSLVLTSKVTGIASPTQSPFVGSSRYTRGKLIKYLLEHNCISFPQLYKDFAHPELPQIINKLSQEGIITVSGDMITL